MEGGGWTATGRGAKETPDAERKLQRRVFKPSAMGPDNTAAPRNPTATAKLAASASRWPVAAARHTTPRYSIPAAAEGRARSLGSTNEHLRRRSILMGVAQQKKTKDEDAQRPTADPPLGLAPVHQRTCRPRAVREGQDRFSTPSQSAKPDRVVPLPASDQAFSALP